VLGGTGWLPPALFALVVWAVQRLLSKLALTDLGTGKFYLLSAGVSLVTYAPFLALRPPARGQLPPAFGLACLMALTFGVTTEAIRRGPLGAVSPITALSPALTAALSVLVLGERLAWPAYLGIALAPSGVVLLSVGRREQQGEPGWQWLALLSLALQGIGAFIAKLVVTPAGPSALLLTSAGVQVGVGLFLAPPWRWRRADLLRRPAIYTVVAYATAGVATIGYLSALAAGPAAVVVPLVATSPALAGVLGIVFLREPTSRKHLAGIALAIAGAVLLGAVG
jgi:drug/metabolite transporter (DMT)-like permease